MSYVKKSWYTLKEAAARLAVRYTDFNERDLLQLGLERRATLSVVFADDVIADEFSRVAPGEIEYSELPALLGQNSIKVPSVPVVFDYMDHPYRKTGRRFALRASEAHQLAMIGGEVADVHDQLWKHFRRPREQTANLDGTFCFSELDEGGEVYYSLFRLMEPFGGDQIGDYPMGRLPPSALIVIAHEDLVGLLGAEDEEEAGLRDEGSARDAVVQVDPLDLPEHLDAANIAYRAVTNGFGDAAATFKGRLVAFLRQNYPTFTEDAIECIAKVANPNKSPGRPRKR